MEDDLHLVPKEYGIGAVVPCQDEIPNMRSHLPRSASCVPGWDYNASWHVVILGLVEFGERFLRSLTLGRPL